MANDLTLSQALAKIETLNANLTTARATIESHHAAITALTAERDNALTRATTAETALASANTTLTSAQAEVSTLKTANAALEAKEQDITKRAGAIAIQTMASVGQPAVPTSAAPPATAPAVVVATPGKSRLVAIIEKNLADQAVARTR